MDALESGHDVMVFSDNVPVAEEVALKTYAASRNALVMGPDCGTAVIDGVGLGFANAVRPGRIGLVAASGTGCQQLLTLLHHAGAALRRRRRPPRPRRRRPRPLVRRRRDLAPARRCAASTPTPTSTWSSWSPSPRPPRWRATSRRTSTRSARLSSSACSVEGQRDLTAVAEAVLARLGHDAPEWPVAGRRQHRCRDRPPAPRPLRRRDAVRRVDADRDRGARPDPQQHPAVRGASPSATSCSSTTT